MSPETINKLGFHLTRYHGTVEGRHALVDGWLYESFDDPKGITGRRMADASEIMLWHLIEMMEQRPAEVRRLEAL